VERTPRPPVHHGHEPDQHELSWLVAALPDGLYAPPPDLAAQSGEHDGQRLGALLVAGLLLGLGLLLALIALVAPQA
jgi:hypothetical protein